METHFLSMEFDFVLSPNHSDGSGSRPLGQIAMKSMASKGYSAEDRLGYASLVSSTILCFCNVQGDVQVPLIWGLDTPFGTFCTYPSHLRLAPDSFPQTQRGTDFR